ncbi:putative pectinesterase [Helianthus anomalus]
MNHRKPLHPPIPTHRFISTMTIIFIFFISLLILTHPTTTICHSTTDTPPIPDLIQQACKATRYQQLCESSLTQYPNKTPIQIIQSTLTVSYNTLLEAQSMAQQILDSSTTNLNRITTAKNCNHLNNSGY